MSVASSQVTADPAAAAMVRRVEARIHGYGRARAVVAFSGGVDSATVLALAARALGRGQVTAITAVSPSLPGGELDEARDVSAGIGVAHRRVATHELDRDAYARNDAMRCFHCKTELYVTLNRIAESPDHDDAVVLAGANADDAHDFRPGLEAAGRHRVRNPLLDEGMTKADVRAMARWLALPVADKPALACLSSRVAYGIVITPELLARIDQAERAVRALGFEPVRVRHLGDEASVEVSAARVADLRADPRWAGVTDSLRAMGWDRVTVDPAGYRMGSLNASLPALAQWPSARRPGRTG